MTAGDGIGAFLSEDQVVAFTAVDKVVAARARLAARSSGFGGQVEGVQVIPHEVDDRHLAFGRQGLGKNPSEISSCMTSQPDPSGRFCSAVAVAGDTAA